MSNGIGVAAIQRRSRSDTWLARFDHQRLRDLMSKCVCFRVVGRVQGVWYRGSTQAEAERLGLTGWARNLRNGDVEVLACGDASAIDQLEQWLWEGPRLAHVVEVKRKEADVDPPPHFSTR